MLSGLIARLVALERRVNDHDTLLRRVWGATLGFGQQIRVLDLSSKAGSGGGGGSGLIRVQIPVGEIPSGSSAQVTLYDADHTLGSDTLTAWNRSGGVIGNATAAKVGYIAYIAREREWQVVQEVC